jgi:hypothetical protein
VSNFIRLFVAAVALQLAITSPAHAQAPILQACTQVKDEIKCDEPSFSAALKAAKTVAIATRPENRASESALRGLIHDLGKTEQPEPADLTFELVRNDQAGLFYGPGDRLLAVLRVYAHGAQGGRGPLVWVESYAGEPDVPWPAVAHRAMQQFKSEFK